MTRRVQKEKTRRMTDLRAELDIERLQEAVNLLGDSARQLADLKAGLRQLGAEGDDEAEGRAGAVPSKAKRKTKATTTTTTKKPTVQRRVAVAVVVPKVTKPAARKTATSRKTKEDVAALEAEKAEAKAAKAAAKAAKAAAKKRAKKPVKKPADKPTVKSANEPRGRKAIKPAQEQLERDNEGDMDAADADDEQATDEPTGSDTEERNVGNGMVDDTSLLSPAPDGSMLEGRRAFDRDQAALATEKSWKGGTGAQKASRKHSADPSSEGRAGKRQRLAESPSVGERSLSDGEDGFGGQRAGGGRT
ncbi:hypothetical protein LTR85_008270 [Meristemomyces frigidus]|nr:hypothetical protein LTR85_008270 [Meristemomyces frigidus]